MYDVTIVLRRVNTFRNAIRQKENNELRRIIRGNPKKKIRIDSVMTVRQILLRILFELIWFFLKEIE